MDGVTLLLSCRILRNCHDDASRFTYLLAKPSCDYLEQEDFIPLLQVPATAQQRVDGESAMFILECLYFHIFKCLPRTCRPLV